MIIYENPEIRAAMIRANLRHKDVAAAIGVRSESFCRMMRKPLTDKRKAQILDAIATMKEREDRKPPLKSHYVSRLNLLMDLKGLTRSQTAKILKLDRAALDQILDEPRPEQSELLSYLCEVLSRE